MTAASSRRPAATDPRKRLISAIHASAAKAGLEEEARRDLMERATGKRSAADMTMAELGKVLDAITGGGARTRGAPHRPWIAKARALWWDLYWLGVIQDSSDRALSAFVARQTGVQRIDWLGPVQQRSVIEALKDWLAREGVAWPPQGNSIEPECMVALAIWQRLEAAGVVGPGGLAALIRYAGQVLGRTASGARDWSEIIKTLGRRLRAQQEAR